MPPSSSPSVPLRRSVADVDSEEDERTNDLAAMVERLKLSSVDYSDLAKVFQQKLDFVNEDEALFLVKSLREFKLKNNEIHVASTREQEDSKENDVTQSGPTVPSPSLKRLPVPDRQSELHPKSSVSRTPPRSTRKAPKPLELNDRKGLSPSRGRTLLSPFRRNSVTRSGDQPARSQSPFRFLSSMRSQATSKEQKDETINGSFQTEAHKATAAPNKPDSLRRTPQNHVPPTPSLFTPEDSIKPSSMNTFPSPPSCDFTPSPGNTSTITGLVKDTSCVTGAHKNRRTTATPYGLSASAASLESQFQSETKFVASATNIQDAAQHPSAPFTAHPEDIRFHMGGMSARKNHRMFKIKAKRPKSKIPTQTVNDVFSKANIAVPISVPVPLAQNSTTPLADTRTSSGMFSPMDHDLDEELHMEYQQPEVQPFLQDVQVKFNIGSSDKITSPSKARSRRMVGRKACGNLATTGRRVPQKLSHLQSQSISTSVSSESVATSLSDQTDSTAASTSGTDVCQEGRIAYVKSLREEGRSFYMQEDYKSSVLCYTKALGIHCQGCTDEQGVDDVRAVLLANRGAALMMATAYTAAVRDCMEALKYLSSGMDSDRSLPLDGGPLLKCKVLIRLGRSLVKLGELEHAEKAFEMAGETEAIARSIVKVGQTNESYLNQTLTDAVMGKEEARRCRDLVYQLQLLGMTSLNSPTQESRRINIQALSLVNTALSMSSGSHNLHSMQIAILAALKRWREVAGCCERLAAEQTRFDGALIGDLESENPFPGVPLAVTLDPKFFEGDDFKVRKLSSKKAVVEVALRLPPEVLPFYVRALRLEERYQLAVPVIAELELRLSNGSDNSKCVSWLPQEKSKLERTLKLKDEGDNLYVNGKYADAMKIYSTCLLIDGEGHLEVGSSEGSNGGGKLHAVLHCNRAACYMSLSNYTEAIKDCTAALRIHTHYMKAMLRRSRCYVRLVRLDEAIAEYNHYIELVIQHQKDGVHEHTSCLFDGPKEVTADILGAVKKELSDVKQSKEAQEEARREEQARTEERRKWYSEAFGKTKPGNDAKSRRDQWYNQQGTNDSRHWDSFNGRGPHPNSRSSWRQYSESNSEERRQDEPRSNSGIRLPSSPGSDTSKNHYTILQISPTASEADIKRGYRQMALKYHPDKNQDTSASDMFRRIKLAYDVLSNPTSRRQYDVEIRSTRRF